MISKQHKFSFCVTVSVLLAVWMDVTSGMISIQLIPEYPVIGRSVILSVTGITGKIQSIVWYKGLNTHRDYQILSYFPDDKERPQSNGALYNSRMMAVPNGSLQISNLNKTDEGFYLMRIQTEKPNDTSVYLTIYDMVGKPTINSSISNPKENDTVTLNCSTVNQQSIIWDRVPSGATMPENNKTISFKISRWDTGKYTCKAINPVSEKTSDPFNITVAYGPENVTITKQKLPNGTISLNCSAISVPPPTYQWKLDGTDINVQKKIHNVDPRQAKNEGMYTCVVNNSVTNLTDKYMIHVSATSDAPNNTNESENVHLDNSNPGLIIGIVIAVILVLGLTATSVYLFIIHRRKKRLSSDRSTDKTKISTRNGQTNSSTTAAKPEPPELQYADIVFNKNMPKRQQPTPESLYANRVDIARPLETVYSELRLN